MFCGVCMAGCCGELLLAWVAWVGCENGMMWVVVCGGVGVYGKNGDSMV